MTYKKNCFPFYSIVLSIFLMFSCSSEHENIKNGLENTSTIQTSIAAFQTEGKISSLENENEIKDIQACLFENGLMTQIYTDLNHFSDTYSLKLKNMSGTLYMLANTAEKIDLQQMKEKGITEKEWLKTTIQYENGHAPHFFSGKLNLKEYQGQSVLPMKLKHGTARFDLLMRAGGIISLKSLTLKNMAQASYLLPQDEAASPENVPVQDIQINFQEPLLQDSLGIAYVCEQENPQLKVVAEMEMGGKTYIKEAELPSTLKRNTVYTLTVRKDALSADIKLEVAEWEDGGNVNLRPDLDSHITVDKNSSILPEGVTVSQSGDMVSLPSRAMDFTLALNCDDELEFVSTQSPDITVETVTQKTADGNQNRFLFHKRLLPPGYPQENVKVFFRRKGLNASYTEDCITLVLEQNPIQLEGGLNFDRQNYTCDFGRYIDNELGRFIMPEGMELVAEFDNEDPWIKVEQTEDNANVYRVIGGWKPNDPKADGRKQAARLVVRSISGRQETEAYIVERRNYGLPVTYLNGTWWCRYNAIGNSADFNEQVLCSNDPARLAGKTVQEYLKTCSSEEYLYLWNAAYEGNDGIALKAVYRNGTITLNNWRNSESNHINTTETTALAPDGYEMPSFDDYNDIFSSFTIPVEWTGFYPQNDDTDRQNRSEIILEKRSGIQLEGQDLGELWSFSVRSIAGHGDEPLTFYGVGCQWNSNGINSNWLLLACHNPGIKGWLVRGNNASLEHNGAAANNTRIIRFKKSPVEYIYR